MIRSSYSLAIAVGLICLVGQVRADDASAASAPAPTKHQLMKDCMAKQKASDGGIPKEQMKKSCKDVTQTENENAKTDKETADQPSSSPPTSSTPHD